MRACLNLYLFLLSLQFPHSDLSGLRPCCPLRCQPGLSLEDGSRKKYRNKREKKRSQTAANLAGLNRNTSINECVCDQTCRSLTETGDISRTWEVKRRELNVGSSYVWVLHPSETTSWSKSLPVLTSPCAQTMADKITSIVTAYKHNRSAIVIVSLRINLVSFIYFVQTLQTHAITTACMFVYVFIFAGRFTIAGLCSTRHSGREQGLFLKRSSLTVCALYECV